LEFVVDVSPVVVASTSMESALTVIPFPAPTAKLAEAPSDDTVPVSPAPAVMSAT
jgi:hypothetical protein